MKKASCKENVSAAATFRSELVIAVQLIDQDIQERVKILIPDGELHELRKKVAICLQVERNDWQAKMQSVFRQLDHEHKKFQKVKNALLDILLNHYPPEKYQSIFGENLEIKDFINDLKEMVVDLKSVNLKLVQDVNRLTKSKDFCSAVSNKNRENHSRVLKPLEYEKEFIPDQNLREYGKNKSIACCKLKDWCQDKSLVSYYGTDQCHDIFEKQHKENMVNKETEPKVHEEEPVIVGHGDNGLLSNQESINSTNKEHSTICNEKSNLIKTYINRYDGKMKDELLLKPLRKACTVRGRVKPNSQRKETLHCHRINGYDIETDLKNQIFQEKFFCKVVAKGSIKHIFPGEYNKKLY